MRTVPEGLAAHLKGATTTTATCWRLTREDGVVLGFTDHDEALVFEGTRFAAATGLTGGEAETALGLAAGTEEVEGALSSLAIEEADIAAGRYDGARVEVFLVNWQDVDERLLTEVAELGEVKRGGPAFTAELRGLQSRLDRQRGRLYRRRCDAVLGDARCRIDLALPVHRAASVVRQAGAGGIAIEGLGSVDAAAFRQGHLVWTSGALAGTKRDIASIRGLGPGEARIALMGDLGAEPTPGDGLTLVAGCDKSFGTCRERFGNGLNFRGFPHLPGTDAAMGFAKEDGEHDGSPLVP